MDSIGTILRLTIFGESHSPAIGAVLDGLAPGTIIDEQFISEMLQKRRPSGATDTARVELDQFSILSGVVDGRATGSPISIVIPNENIRPHDYSSTLARPSHADYTAQVKFNGFQARSGGGHFSGRITAAIVAAGAICLQALERKGILIGTHILSCAGIKDISFLDNSDPSLVSALRGKDFPVIGDVEQEMKEAILSARNQSDSVGGVIQTAIIGLPAGVGEPCFESLEGAIAKAVFAIGGIKGIEFGSGFELPQMRGSQANDAFRIEDGRVITETNHSGGINGGISNGMPVVYNMAVRPTPSISQRQNTIDFERLENTQIEIRGRHDPAIVRRICIVVTCMSALVLYDLLAQQFGKQWFVAE